MTRRRRHESNCEGHHGIGGRNSHFGGLRFGEGRGLSCRLLCKLESLNPAGSVKDRVALWMIREGERSGKLTPGAAIIEPTSGNTGIGLAAIGGARGYRVILTMPDTMSQERRELLKAYGAQIVLTEGAKGMRGPGKGPGAGRVHSGQLYSRPI